MPLPPLNPDEPRSPGLGSLAQSAREKKLKQVRVLLIVVGALTIGVNIFGLISFHSEVDKARAQGQMIDQQKLESLVRTVDISGAIAIGLGVLFVIFGIIIYQFPVPITIISLVLFVGASIIFRLWGMSIAKDAGLEPGQFVMRGLIFDVFITIALASAIKTAVAYQKEQQAAADLEPEYE
jgi:hypothetical protein